MTHKLCQKRDLEYGLYYFFYKIFDQLIIMEKWAISVSLINIYFILVTSLAGYSP